MADKQLQYKLNTVETNIKKYIDEHFSEFKEYLESKTKTKLTQEQPEFSVNYFMEIESSDPNEILQDEADAETLIDGILNLKLDTQNVNSRMLQKLNKFTTFQLCR